MTHSDDAHPLPAGSTASGSDEGLEAPAPRPPYDDQVPAAEADEIVPMRGGRGGRRRKRKRVKSCLAVLVALATVLAVFYVGVTRGVGFLRDQFAAPEDYAGPGHGKVTFQVHDGDSVAEMGRNLKSAGVVASVGAFTDAARSNPDATGIQVGYYPLKKEMKASDALEVLVDPGNLMKNSVTVPEGLRVTDVLGLLADGTDFSRAQFKKVLARPAKLGLPSYAHGNAEGYLFPATYDFGPKATPTSILHDMVARWKQAASDADLKGAAKRLGYSPGDLMTVASLVQAEGRGSYMPKIARVIYNRLEGSETGHLLQIDATVDYAADNKLTAVPTTDDLKIDSPYNTYQNPGLPPTPIEAPGDDALKAATHPADGDWYYYVTVNLKTGETKFASSYDQFLKYKNELRQYCATESAGAC